VIHSIYICINDAYGKEPTEWPSLESLEVAINDLGWMPDGGLREGHDYEIIDIGSTIRRQREELGLSIRDLEKLIQEISPVGNGLSYSFIQKLELGKNTNPRRNSVALIEKVLKIDLLKFLD
jgi:hypothetical protein